MHEHSMYVCMYILHFRVHTPLHPRDVTVVHSDEVNLLYTKLFPMSQLLRSFARIAATSRSSTSTLPHQLFFSRANNSHFPVRKFSSTKSIFEATLDMAPVNTTSRLESLRKLMSERSIDIYSKARLS